MLTVPFHLVPYERSYAPAYSPKLPEIAAMYERDERIRITLARKKTELKQIIGLQKANLRATVGEEVAAKQGFLTAVHDYTVLEDMNRSTAAVIAKSGTKVVGYALAMTRPYAAQIPTLTDVWELQEQSSFRGQPLSEVEYLGMGQVCVAEEARGQKVVDRMYRYLRTCYSLRFEYLITAVAPENTRSLRVHERIGFKELGRERTPAGKEWIVVGWDWRK